MARRLRIQYPGALYHVINRGNYRRDVFVMAGAAEAMVRALAEATVLYGWRVHGYVVMSNHYHLAVETPQPNLVEGMHWLQSTFATRFNRFRQEHGHLFQGRYQSILIENYEALCRVVDYIHLNPVRAGIVVPGQVAKFRWSSLSRLLKHERFSGLVAEDWLRHRHLEDTPEGWRDYVTQLVDLATDTARQKELGFESFSSGWAIGTSGWRKAVAEDHANLALSPGLGAEETQALRSATWERVVQEELRRAVRTEGELQASGKTVRWKVELALAVRRRSGAAVTWLAQRLKLGSAATARTQLSLANRRLQKSPISG
jgi:REP element-mobilizing transposase RayT